MCNFVMGNKKSQGVKSGMWGGWGTTPVFWGDKNWCTDEPVCTGILSWVMKYALLVLPPFNHFWYASSLFGLGQQICDWTMPSWLKKINKNALDVWPDFITLCGCYNLQIVISDLIQQSVAHRLLHMVAGEQSRHRLEVCYMFMVSIEV
jgi:hypothetical protein